MRNTVEMLDELQNRALHDPELKEKLLQTRESEDPLGELCRVIQAGDEFYATMKRSTNGGGENSPVLEGEDDMYELFFAGLK